MAQLADETRRRAFDVPVTIHHWQLRDLLLARAVNIKQEYSLHEANHGLENAFGSGSRRCFSSAEVLFAHDTSIQAFDLSLGRVSRAVLKCNFLPTAIASGCGLVAAGGRVGQIKICSESIDHNIISRANHRIGRDVTNSLTLSPSSRSAVHDDMSTQTSSEFPDDVLLDSCRLIVSSNDCSVKIFHAVSMEPLDLIQCGESAPNSTALTRDSRLLAVACDSGAISLYNERVDGSFESTHILPPIVSGAEDPAAMSVSWDATSRRFAVGSQDGYVRVWDIRSLQTPQMVLRSVQPGAKGAVRCVKFSRSLVNSLIAFSEHVSLVHIADSRSGTTTGFGTGAQDDICLQTIHVPAVRRDADIAGMCFAPDTTSLYMASEASLIELPIFDSCSRRAFPCGIRNFS